MADVAHSHPELARRWTLLVERAWERSWDLYIASSSRSYQTQHAWWELFMQDLWPAPVANPDQDWGPTPWGWRAVGSLHMVQEDGFSHALDVGWTGPHQHQFHALAWSCGLRFPEPGENWHAQWWGLDGVYPVEEDEGMKPEQLGLIRDPEHEDIDVWGMMLVESYTPPVLDPNGVEVSPEVVVLKWYPYATAVTFIHQGFKVWSATHP